MNPQNSSKLEDLTKQRDQLNKIISELNDHTPHETNIPYPAEFTCEYPKFATSVDFHSLDPKELLQIRVFVNKKCNQISTSFEHTLNLANQIIPHANHPAFMELLVRKFLDQGRVQVSSHLDSYKPLSFILSQLRGPEIFRMLIKLVIYQKGSESELVGVYSIYFGVLDSTRNIEGAWFWLASILNVKPNSATGYILEAFLNICGNLLNEAVSLQFHKMINYIRKYFIKEIDNKPVETRIDIILSKFKVLQ